MNNNASLNPDYIFEVSWEVCNKVGGIHTVISTKAISLVEKFGDNYITIGPDIMCGNGNPEFIEDVDLFKSWKEMAKKDGLHIRIGRWNISGSPVAVIVDFTNYFEKKDEIFATFWENYGLDSLSGQWDYIEPGLFGYAAAKVVESFSEYNLTARDNIIAQFHEWMTGVGILYIKKNLPYVATAFTTHATVLGRSICGNNLPLYNNISQYDPDQKAQEFNVTAKLSLEKISAKEADVFTVVSALTGNECKQFLGKAPDFITPNGFEDTFVPEADVFEEKRSIARERLKKVAEAVLCYKLKDDTLFVATSGRYEFKNKGYDLFVDAFGKLNNSQNLQKEIVVFIMVPGNHYGPRKKLLKKLTNNEYTVLDNKILTHGIHDSKYDPILKEISKNNLDNSESNKVKVIFVPTYLNGSDGIFNLSYFDLLIGMDLTVFPSYYEPWGYTPLESIAFHIPTITTSLAGFGLWVQSQVDSSKNKGVTVIERTDNNDNYVIFGIVEKIEKFASLDDQGVGKYRDNAFEISRLALWRNFLDNYLRAYTSALNKARIRKREMPKIVRVSKLEKSIQREMGNDPIWNRVIVETKIPDALEKLKVLAHNLWWSWKCEVQSIFEQIDTKLWNQSEENPIIMFENIPYSKFMELEKDSIFMDKLNSLYSDYKKYMNREKKTEYKVAYFSMEFGLHDSVKIFSGGLGILAGDYLKEASDTCTDIVGVGLLYRYGYFKQFITINGEQITEYEPQKFSHIPIEPVHSENEKWLTISVAFPGRMVKCRVWKLNVGKVILYMLDSDFDENLEEDRKITHQLYGGDLENRIKQEMLLGIGGVRLLKALNINPDIYHCNEGHAAFLGLERLSDLVNIKRFSFAESLEIVKASTLFTTHTPVPAGHDAFPEDMMRKYFMHYPKALAIDWDDFLNLGKFNVSDNSGKFSMSHLAIHISGEINGVSKLHGEITKSLFKNMWRGYGENESHIGYVTNGVHLPSWISQRWCKLYLKYFNNEFELNQSDPKFWQKIHDIDDKELWEIKNFERSNLIKYIKVRFENSRKQKNEHPKTYLNVISKISDKVLTLGFARRFATYKRAHLLFKDIERLSRIVNDANRPVQFIFAGKAHPNDGGGQDLIKFIVNMSKKSEFIGKILFLENYNIELAKKMVSGVDVWLNTPTRPLEASGTSGMKAIMNGVLNLSVLDGWWVEGYKENAGWAIPQERTYINQDFQDELDAELLYNLIENEVKPAFYDRNEEGIPTKWIEFMKNSISGIAHNFTTKRMIDDYISKFYNKLYNRSIELAEDNYEKVKDIATWKKRISRSWDSIKVIEKPDMNLYSQSFKIDEAFESKVVLDLKELSVKDIGVELVIGSYGDDKNIHFIETHDLKVDEIKGKIVSYKLSLIPFKAGALNFGIRIYPKNEDIVHRQDFAYVKWI